MRPIRHSTEVLIVLWRSSRALVSYNLIIARMAAIVIVVVVVVVASVAQTVEKPVRAVVVLGAYMGTVEVQ